MTRWLLALLATAVVAAPAAAQYTVVSQGRTVSTSVFLEGPNDFVKGDGYGETAPDLEIWNGDAVFSTTVTDGTMSGSATQTSDLGVASGLLGTDGMSCEVALEAYVDVVDPTTTFAGTYSDSGFRVTFTIDEPSEWMMQLDGGSTNSSYTWGFARLERFGSPDVFDHDLAVSDSFSFDESGTIMPGTYELWVAYQISSEVDEELAEGGFTLFFDVTTVATPVESASWSDLKSSF